jgi:hypothetical protein
VDTSDCTTISTLYLVEVEKNSKIVILDSFQTIIPATGMLSATEPDSKIKFIVSNIEEIGDAKEVHDIFHTGNG